MTESFVPVTPTEGPLTLDLLQQFAANDQFLFENLPKVTYRADVTRSRGLKILCGKAVYTADTTKSYQNIQISFGGYFSAGSSPIVVATAYSRRNANKYVSIRGIDGNGADVDHRGFNATIMAGDSTQVESAGYVHWIAIGL